MRILIVHAAYQQRGGEDSVVDSELELLRRHGHDVVEYRVHNSECDRIGRLQLARRTIWSHEAYRELQQLVRRERPDVAHFHNTLPLISPAGYHAVRELGVAVVQTLHNYRLICPGATLFRAGGPCEDCVPSRAFLPALRHRCYRGSLLATATVASMLGFHRAKGTWARAVDAYISLTGFARERFVAGGLPAERIAIKPNFLVDDPGVASSHADAAVFVGRLSEEKGVRPMLDCLPFLPEDFELRVVGDGPLRPLVDEAARRDPRLKVLGAQTREQCLAWIADSAALLLPSTNYEGFPMTIVESFAQGVPVVATDLGSMASLVVDGHNGQRFPVGDPAAMANALASVVGDRELRARLSHGARADYDASFRADANYRTLLRIYEAAIRARATDTTIELDDDLIGGRVREELACAPC